MPRGAGFDSLNAVRSIVALVLLFATAAAGCTRVETGHKVTWRTLARGLTSAIETPRRLVIRKEADYLKLWAEHASTVDRLGFPPDVDFDREMVIFVSQGTKPTGGYYIEVVDAEIRGSRLRVLVGEREPQPGDLQIQHVTQPYQFIALPIVAGRVEFRTVYEAGGPRRRRKARPGEDGPRAESPQRPGFAMAQRGR